jgi:predicted dehydrogenase
VVSRKHGIRVFSRLKNSLQERYAGAFICTPTSLHIPLSIELAEKGLHLFIEKPLSNNLERVDELSRIVDKKGLAVLIACNLRFMSTIRLIKKLIEKNKIGKIFSVKAECGFYLPFWHPGSDYRREYSANRRLGGGVILDDIHDTDLLYWFFGEVQEAFCFAEKISELEIDTEDIAEIFLRFKSGPIAQVHLDYLQRTYRRYYEFIGEKGIIVWDYIKQQVSLCLGKANRWTVLQEGININHERMFIDEIRHFINCIKGNETSVNDISQAREVLRIALACYRSAERKKVVYL